MRFLRLGFENDYVMRGILAISALHLAYFRPLRREFYLAQAVAQHEAGLHQATGILSNITEHNCNALYIFTAISCIYTLASPRLPGDLLVSIIPFLNMPYIRQNALEIRLMKIHRS